MLGVRVGMSAIRDGRALLLCRPCGLTSLQHCSLPNRVFGGRLASLTHPEQEVRSFSEGVEIHVSPDKPRGGLPRFHLDELPASKGVVVRVAGDEFWHMAKVLRLKVNDRVELFDGRGGIVEACLVDVDRQGVDVAAVGQPRILPPTGPSWHVAAAFGSLKGGRADWLVEKCTELGARSLTPLVTQRSTVTGRKDRWVRIVQAASKQCQRLHALDLKDPIDLHSFLPEVANSQLSLLAVAGAPPMAATIHEAPAKEGLLLVGPEGDFTEEEISELVAAGAKPVGLGPRRLRVETAAVALLATVMLMSDHTPP